MGTPQDAELSLFSHFCIFYSLKKDKQTRKNDQKKQKNYYRVPLVTLSFFVVVFREEMVGCRDSAIYQLAE